MPGKARLVRKAIAGILTAGLVCVLVCSCSEGKGGGGDDRGSAGNASAPTLDGTKVYAPDQAAKAHATNAATNDPVDVDVTLAGCARSADVPPSFLPVFSKYLREGGGMGARFKELADEAGHVSDGYAFVQVALAFTNNNDFACELDLGNRFVCQYDDSGYPRYSAPFWVLEREDDGTSQAKDYFQPQLPPAASATYTLGYIVPTDILDSKNVGLLLASDHVNADVGNVRVFDLSSYVDPKVEKKA